MLALRQRERCWANAGTGNASIVNEHFHNGNLTLDNQGKKFGTNQVDNNYYQFACMQVPNFCFQCCSLLYSFPKLLCNSCSY